MAKPHDFQLHSPSTNLPACWPSGPGPDSNRCSVRWAKPGTSLGSSNCPKLSVKATSSWSVPSSCSRAVGPKVTFVSIQCAEVGPPVGLHTLMYFGILHLHDMQYKVYNPFQQRQCVFFSMHTHLHLQGVHLYIYIYIHLHVQVGDSFASWSPKPP